MIAVDTNVWVRYLTDDDPEQARQALRLLAEADEVFVPKTVLLELEWVLRAVYSQAPTAIERALLQVLGLPQVRVEAPDQVIGALALYRAGCDFADALHLRGGGEGTIFYTFDRAFVARAQALGEAVALP